MTRAQRRVLTLVLLACSLAGGSRAWAGWSDEDDGCGHPYGVPGYRPTPYVWEWHVPHHIVQPARVPLTVAQPCGPTLYLPYHLGQYYGPRYEGFRPGWFLEGAPAMPLGW